MISARVFAVCLLVLAARPLQGQWLSRLNSPIPLWADSAFASADFWARYDLTSRLDPQVAFGDLDGDGLFDVAVAIVQRGGRRRGIAIVHQIDRSVHIVGAGTPLGNAGKSIESVGAWGLSELLHHRTAVHVADWHVAGWLVWNGQSYVWVPDTD